MKVKDIQELLKDKRVIEEINNYLWIESQKVGYSIGFERAADEWIRLHSKEWAKYHRPDLIKEAKSKPKKRSPRREK